VEVKGSINAEGKLVVDELELENFLELEIDAFIVEIPGDTLLLLLDPGSPSVTVQFSLAVSGTTFPMVITPRPRSRGRSAAHARSPGRVRGGLPERPDPGA
jgi:hypothetical protein